MFKFKSSTIFLAAKDVTLFMFDVCYTEVRPGL